MTQNYPQDLEGPGYIGPSIPDKISDKAQKERGERREKMWLFGIILIIISLVVTGFFVAVEQKTAETTETFEVWDAVCPFGHYWEDFEGGGFIGFSVDTSLVESYIIKYLHEEDGLRTIIVPSTSYMVHIYFTDDNTSMSTTISWQGQKNYPYFTTDDETNLVRMDIYIPDPKILVGA